MRPRALGVHIFAGGFSIGVERHFDLLGHLERGSFGVRSWREYRPLVPVHVDRRGAWDVAPFVGAVDLLYANPPCAPWSTSTANNFSAHGRSAPLLEWTRDVFRIAKAVRARAVVVESVRGAMTAGADTYRAIRDEYEWGALQWVVVNAADYGLPQVRPRVFMLFLDRCFRPEWAPRPRVGIADAIAGAPGAPLDPRSIYKYKGMTCADILACIPAVGSGQQMDRLPRAALVALAPAMANWKITFHAHILRRPRPEGQIGVVWSSAKHIHPTEDRMMTLRELMRATGYPEDFTFAGNQPSALQQLGKTVCPPVAEWVAGELAAHLRGERDILDDREAVAWCTSDARRVVLAPQEAIPGAPMSQACQTMGPSLGQVEHESALGRREKAAGCETPVPVQFELFDHSASLFPGPTSLARHLIAKGMGDDDIMASTRKAFGQRTDGPHLFTRGDLKRLRARIEKKKEALS